MGFLVFIGIVLYGFCYIACGLEKVNRKEAREREKFERAQERINRRIQRDNNQRIKEEIKERKARAKDRGYYFEKDEKTKKDDERRLQGDLRDYVFWQYFSFPYETKYEDEATQQFLKDEVFCKKKNWKAEWRIE